MRGTKQGKVKGTRVQVLGRTVEVYKGIPYAEPPVGELRFKPPVPCASWDVSYYTTFEKIACPQFPAPTESAVPFKQTEDCLYLNVWKPENVSMRPVLVWIHGGGFARLSSYLDKMNGEVLAAQTGLVVVSMNYRLGILGFLNANTTDASGNQGLLDQHMALKWVQDNIHVFGGDPSMVTVFGQSAGAMSIHAHILSPMSKGLFKRAVMMSGSLYTSDYYDTVKESVSKGNGVAEIVNCSNPNQDLYNNADEVLKCLRSKSVDELILATQKFMGPKHFSFLPTFHNRFLPHLPIKAVDIGMVQDVDVIVGVTSDEGAFSLLLSPMLKLERPLWENMNYESFESEIRQAVFSWSKSDMSSKPFEYGDNEELRRLYIDYLSNRQFKCPVQFFAEQHASRSHAVYSYVFAHLSKKNNLPFWMGVPHSYEIEFFFGIPLRDQVNYTDEDRIVSENIVTILSSFANTGNPKLPGGQGWPKYTATEPISAVIDRESFTFVRGYSTSQCEPWRNYI
ncbi:acetylcholinesterase-like [Ixodes scapularis]|uniref:acetylcholinesterase-like n=1 Tax=Ixodes scapularis TaxID=6945 RepID=UPI001C3869D6|nr:acetylcholinesterase-like [Ixodes scapularis]